MSRTKQGSIWYVLACVVLVTVFRVGPPDALSAEAAKPKESAQPGAQEAAVQVQVQVGEAVEVDETGEARTPQDQTKDQTPAEARARIEAQIGAMRARLEAERKAMRERMLTDPAWAATHEQVAVIDVAEGGTPARLHDFCLDTGDNILACCGGARIEYVVEGDRVERKTVTQAGEIRVFSPQGKLLATWELPELTPQAIAVHRDGTVFVGGNGRLARLDRNGNVLRTADSPAMPKMPPKDAEPEQPREEAESEEGESEEGDEQPEAEKSPTILKAVVRVFLGGGGEKAEETEEAGEEQEEEQQQRQIDRDLEARREAALARRMAQVNSIAVSDRDLFVACPSRTGYAVWRTDHDFGNPVRIIDRLRGCCGQMDLRAGDGELFVAENGRHRVVRYDRDGNELGAWGKRDRQAADGFGSCCNPMNLCFGPEGELYTSESGPPDVVKRFTPSGEFLGVVALPELGGGCVRVAVEASRDGSHVYVLNTGKSTIHVFADKRFLPTHRQVAVIKMPAGAGPAALHTFCINADGNLLACCGGERTYYVRTSAGLEIKTVSEPAAIKVVDLDGKLLATWKLELTPQAVNVGPDGTVFVGGNGRLAKLDPDGKVLLEADSPTMAELKALIAEAEANLAPKNEDDGGTPGDEQTGDEKPGEAKELSEAEKAAENARAEQARMMKLRAVYMIRRKTAITGIAVTERDLFVACGAVQGYGYDVWRMDHDFGSPVKIVGQLRGCCGQMDVQARNGELYVAENARGRVVRYNRDGEELAAWGKRDRKGVVGFGSCCNPMNVRFGPGGEVYTSEASLGRIKRFTPDGEFLGLVGTADIIPGCKHVAIGVGPEGDRIFLLDITRSQIAVLGNGDPAEAETDAEDASSGETR